MDYKNDFPMLKKDIIYLDNCATTLKPYSVINEITNYYENYSANASRADYDISVFVDEKIDKTRIKVKCVANNELDTDVYIKCKDYEDENYSNWEEREQNEGHTTNAFEKIGFNDKEQKIINLINTKLNINQYFKSEELESFEIINLSKFGYYESEKNILYVTVYYTSKCKDGTYSCDYLDNDKASNVEFNKPFSFLIKVDVENFDFIEKLNGFAAHINSDWKYVSGRIN